MHRMADVAVVVSAVDMRASTTLCIQDEDSLLFGEVVDCRSCLEGFELIIRLEQVLNDLHGLAKLRESLKGEDCLSRLHQSKLALALAS